MESRIQKPSLWQRLKMALPEAAKQLAIGALVGAILGAFLLAPMAGALGEMALAAGVEAQTAASIAALGNPFSSLIWNVAYCAGFFALIPGVTTLISALVDPNWTTEKPAQPAPHITIMMAAPGLSQQAGVSKAVDVAAAPQPEPQARSSKIQEILASRKDSSSFAERAASQSDLAGEITRH